MFNLATYRSVREGATTQTHTQTRTHARARAPESIFESLVAKAPREKKHGSKSFWRVTSLTFSRYWRILHHSRGVVILRDGRWPAKKRKHIIRVLTKSLFYRLVVLNRKVNSAGHPSADNPPALQKSSRQDDQNIVTPMVSRLCVCLVPCRYLATRHTIFPTFRKGDTLTTFDMGESIRGYNRDKPPWIRSHKQWLRQYMISEKDLRWCQRFVDPDG